MAAHASSAVPSTRPAEATAPNPAAVSQTSQAHPAQTQIVNSHPEYESVPDRPHPSRGPEKHDSLKTAAWFLLAAILVFGSIGVGKGLGGRIVVYDDYTDAAVATLGLWGGLALWLGFLIAADSLNTATLADFGLPGFLFVLGVSQILSMRASLRSNPSFSSALLSIAAKLLANLAFVMYAFLYLTSGVDRRRRDDESDVAYALRMTQEEERSKKNRMILAGLSAATVYLMHNLTRNKKWLGIIEYVKGRPRS
jgi:hypothetical protein